MLLRTRCKTCLAGLEWRILCKAFLVCPNRKKVMLGNHMDNSLWLLLSGADSRGDCFGEKPVG